MIVARGLRIAILASIGLTGCEHATPPPAPPAGTSLAASLSNPAAAQRTDGTIYAPPPLTPRIVFGSSRAGERGSTPDLGAGMYSLDFADTDIREAVGQILGTMLGLSYAIDPAVKGSVTLHTARPLTSAQLIGALQTMLGSVGAVLVRSEGLYRVVPAASANGAASLVVPLQYVSAEDLAKILQPLVGASARLTAEPALNALLIGGDPSQAQSLAELVRSFDVDALRGQSYAVMPVSTGSARDMAAAMTDTFRGKSGASLAGLVRVVPLGHMNAVLIISSQPSYIEAAQRVFALIEGERRRTVRIWQVYYLQNSNADDVAYTLQMAFTPNNVTAQPEAVKRAGGARGGGGFASQRPGGAAGGLGGGGASGAGGLSSGGAFGGVSAGGSIGGANPLGPTPSGSGPPPGTPPPAQLPGGANPLLGGLDQATADTGEDAMRILPNTQNNAILVYGTGQEEETVGAMLRKIDIIPMQVRIDATIAEVTLNDTLQYGTQFFFKSGGINGILNNASGPLTTAAQTALGVSFPGFFIGGKGHGGAPFAISALQAVTTVNVLSSPQITVVDNQMARLQVGALVPYLTSSSQSTLTSNAPVINSIAYQPTGVIMEVTPRVNSGGLVTLDVSQEVSDVDTNTTTPGINSPTFNQRTISSRVVVQDGQTIGLAGLIRDSISSGNQGIPWLKDIPILGALAGTQNNGRQRTELLVLLTPHVIRDQADVRALTDDMRTSLSNSAAVPYIAQSYRPSGSSDPNRRVREDIRRALDPAR